MSDDTLTAAIASRMARADLAELTRAVSMLAGECQRRLDRWLADAATERIARNRRMVCGGEEGAIGEAWREAEQGMRTLVARVRALDSARRSA